MKIAITGTPGIGKSTLAKRLAKSLNYDLIDLNEIVKKQKLYTKYDRSLKTYVIEISDFKKYMNKYLKNKKNVILDSHLSHFIKVSMVIVLRCEPSELKKRLRKKRWSTKKVQTNVEAELMNIIANEAYSYNKKVFEIDTTGLNEEKTEKNILKIIKSRKKQKKIDWMNINVYKDSI